MDAQDTTQQAAPGRRRVLSRRRLLRMAGLAGTGAQRHVDRDRSAGEMVPKWREPGLGSAVWRALRTGHIR